MSGLYVLVKTRGSEKYSKSSLLFHRFVKAIPAQARGFQEVEAPRFQGEILVKVIRLSALCTGQWLTERGGLGCSNPPPPRNSEDIGGVLDRISKKNRRLDFLLQFTVFSYGCNLLNKGFF